MEHVAAGQASNDLTLHEIRQTNRTPFFVHSLLVAATTTAATATAGKAVAVIVMSVDIDTTVTATATPS